jgi:hypothetical protein
MATKYSKWPQNISNGRKIDQIVHCKSLQNLPKLGLKINIWQPCFGLRKVATGFRIRAQLVLVKLFVNC